MTRGPKRILVYGVTGSGKTTLARRIAKASGLPLFEVDELAWLPGWRQVPEAEQRSRFGGIAAREEWVLDSAYGVWLDLVLPRAELIVGLDFPRWLSLAWLVRRTVARGLSREPVCNGNVESWRVAFSRESIVLWHFRSFARKRARIRAWANDGTGRCLVFRSPREIEAWLRGFCEGAG